MNVKLYTAKELADAKGVTRQMVYWSVWNKRITPVANGAKAMIFDESAREKFLKMRPGRRKVKKVRGRWRGADQSARPVCHPYRLRKAAPLT